MKMKMKTKNGYVKSLSNKPLSLAEDDLRIERILNEAIKKIPVEVIDYDDREKFEILLNSDSGADNYQFISKGQKVVATLELDRNDRKLSNIQGVFNSGDDGVTFIIDNSDNFEDGLRDAINIAQDDEETLTLSIYRTNLAYEPPKYILALTNEGDAATNVKRSIKTKQTAADHPFELDIEFNAKLTELIAEGDVEITKEKAKPAMKLTTYVMKGENVLVVPRANGILIVKVQKTNGFAQGFFNTIAGFTNAVTNGVERLSGDRVMIDATANKKYSESFKVANDEIKEMDFEEIKDELQKIRVRLYMDEGLDIDEVEGLNMSKGVGGASKRRRNKNNAKYELTALSIEDGDGITICKGEIMEVRESGNKNNIVFVLRPLDGATVSRKKVNGATVNMIFGEVVDPVAAK